MCWLCTQGSVALFPVVQYVRCEHNANVCNDKQQMFFWTSPCSREVLGRAAVAS